MRDIVIVGAGHTGLRAALSARDAGHNGRITVIDRDLHHPPCERPPLSKWKDGIVGSKPIVSLDRLDDAHLTFLHDQIDHLDVGAHNIGLASGQTLTFDRLLLATGARPRPLAVAGVGPIQTLRDKADADAIRANAADASTALIIGAGFLGLEPAASLSALGVAVRVIEQGQRVLARGVSRAVADIVHANHTEHGVSFSLGTAVSELDIQAADLSVAAIGSLPNVSLAEAAGLELQDGIAVDADFRTSAPDIFAAGDCCASPVMGADRPSVRLESWTAAGLQGDIAGRNMVAGPGALPTSKLIPWFWSDQFDFVLQVAGLPENSHTLVERRYGTHHHISFGVSTDGRLGYAVGIAPGAKIGKDIRMAMKLIAAGTEVAPEQLANPDVALKSLLREKTEAGV